MFVTSAYAQEAQPAEGESHAPAGETHAAPADAQAGETHTETGIEHGGGAFPPFDPSNYPSQLLWLAITFGLFYLFLKKVIVPRIGGILEVRHDRIAQDLDQAARMKEDADAAVAAYEQELAEARANANTIGQTARDSAKADAEVERKKVEAELDGKMAEAEKRIGGIKSKAMAEVSNIAEETATAIVQQLTGTKVDKPTVAAAVKAVRN
ncbi:MULTISPECIES: F0F1 ATP synthase subunit B [Mesorhizobium]|uniref:ATP synthase subunit b n=1 Tax=Mesorhizobium denitrificans TaxID=2294114 RepID=A0A371XI30_9HYPH|nr:MULTISPECIES: F0F1 ATP synthase subunit B [Mesorhizobium]RFC68890.1 F0F1 ATP synthase subunit B [Mesorhizobium denitrificans]